MHFAAALPADVALDPPTAAIGFVHRRLRDADLFFLANTSNVPHTVRATFGAIDTLLVDIDVSIDGTVDPESGQLQIDETDTVSNYGVVDEIAKRESATTPSARIP